jgi:molybdate transport system substrate-binding protein
MDVLDSFHMKLSLRNSRILIELALLGLCGNLLGACQAPDETRLTVAAAASLNPAFDEIAAGYKAASGETLVLSFASTGALAEQLRNGGPFDVFAAADAQHVDELIDDGVLRGATRTVFAYGQLVLLISPDFQGELADTSVLLDPGVKRIAIANPEHAPYGLAAEQALKALGVWDRVRNKIIMGETVRQAATFVQTGNADVGLVARSVVTPGKDMYLLIPEDLFDPIEHVAAARSDSNHLSEALQFLEFLSSPEARSTLEYFGFRPPEENQP